MLTYFGEWLCEKLFGSRVTLLNMVICYFIAISVCGAILLVISFHLIIWPIDFIFFHRLPTFNLMFGYKQIGQFNNVQSSVKSVIFFGIIIIMPFLDKKIYRWIQKRKRLQEIKRALEESVRTTEKSKPDSQK